MRIGIVGLILFAFSTSNASAAWIADTASRPILTPLIGTKADGKHRLEIPDGRILNWITGGEAGDKLCRLSMYPVDHLSGLEGPTNVNECRDTLSTDPNHQNSFLNARLPENYVARSIKLCQAKRNDRVKGIELRGKELNEAGADSPFKGKTKSDSDEFKNCDRWSKWSVCPKHHALTGLVLYFDPKGEKKARPLNGVQGICRPIKWVWGQ